jgi:hypothetical protein
MNDRSKVDQLIPNPGHRAPLKFCFPRGFRRLLPQVHLRPENFRLSLLIKLQAVRFHIILLSHVLQT